MTKIQSTLLVLFLVSTALAAPKQHHRHRRPTGTGRGKPSKSTSAPYGYGNSTTVGPTGTGTGAVGPTAYSTLVVSPVPVSSSEVEEPTSETCETPTLTVTSSNTVTVTIGEESSTAAATAFTSGPVESVAPTVYSTSVGYGNDTSSAGPLGPTGIYSTAYPTGTEDVSSVSYPYKRVSHSKRPSVVVSPSSSSLTKSTSIPSIGASSSSSTVNSPSSSTTVPMTSSTSLVSYTPSSSPAVSSTSSATAAASSTVTTVDRSVSLSGAKRGLVYNQPTWLKNFASAVEPCSWAYNWAASASGLPSYLKFVPMLHSLGGNLDNFVASAKAGFGDVDAIMAFNEPDQPAIYGGSDISPSDAATNYRKYMTPLRTQYPNAQLGAPSVSNGNTTYPRLMGMQWLSPFFQLCGDCPIDFVPIHWYGWNDGSAVDQATEFKKYITLAAAEIAVMAKRPLKVWVTEFAAEPKKDANKNKAFMDIVLPWLDNQATMVDRYSYFMVDPGMLITDSTSLALTASGSRYVGNK